MDWYEKFKKMNDEELGSWVSSNSQLGSHASNLAISELTRRSIFRNEKAIRELGQGVEKLNTMNGEFGEKTTKQTNQMITLTFAIFLLTFFMVCGLLVQIYLAKIQVEPILFEQQKNERQAYEFCKGNPESDWPTATGGRIMCGDVLKMLEGEF